MEECTSGTTETTGSLPNSSPTRPRLSSNRRELPPARSNAGRGSAATRFPIQRWSVFAVENKVRDGKQRAAIVAIGQNFQAGFRAADVFMGQGRRASASAGFLHQTGDLLGPHTHELALFQNFRDQTARFRAI